METKSELGKHLITRNIPGPGCTVWYNQRAFQAKQLKPLKLGKRTWKRARTGKAKNRGAFELAVLTWTKTKRQKGGTRVIPKFVQLIGPWPKIHACELPATSSALEANNNVKKLNCEENLKSSNKATKWPPFNFHLILQNNGRELLTTLCSYTVLPQQTCTHDSQMV